VGNGVRGLRQAHPRPGRHLARQALERAQKGYLLVWDPILKDAPCFERFSIDPVYLDTVQYFDELRANLRERLPETLAEFGVEL